MPRLPPQELAFLGVLCPKLGERSHYTYNHLRSGEQKRSNLPSVLVECHRRVVRNSPCSTMLERFGEAQFRL